MNRQSNVTKDDDVVPDLVLCNKCAMLHSNEDLLYCENQGKVIANNINDEYIPCQNINSSCCYYLEQTLNHHEYKEEWESLQVEVHGYIKTPFEKRWDCYNP